MKPEQVREIFRQNLQLRRAELKMTQSQVAKLAGITQAYLSQIESGLSVPPIGLLGPLSGALRTTPDALVSPEIFSGIAVDAS